MQALNNPANTEAKASAERCRIPMSVPVQKLEAPDIPGYHLHWFNGTPQRIQRALDGGYEFVDEREANINNTSLGGTSTRTGNTDMGSRVSVLSGTEIGQDGQPVRLILMKIKQEWYEEDQTLVQARNNQVIDTLTRGVAGAERDAPGDTKQRYVDRARSSVPDFFKRKIA